MLILDEEEEEEEEEVMPSRRSSREAVLTRRSRQETVVETAPSSRTPSARKATNGSAAPPSRRTPAKGGNNVVDLWTETACRLCDRGEFQAETDSLAEHYATAHFRIKLEAEAGGGSRTAAEFPCATCRSKRPRVAAFPSRRQLTIHLAVVHGRAAALLAAKLGLKAADTRPTTTASTASGGKSSGKPGEVQTKNSERSLRGGASDSRTKNEAARESSPEVIELDDDSSRNSDKEEEEEEGGSVSSGASSGAVDEVKVVKDTRQEEEEENGENEENSEEEEGEEEVESIKVRCEIQIVNAYRQRCLRVRVGILLSSVF